MKYIDSEKLIAEIERRKNQTERRIDNIVPIRRKDTMDEEQLAKIELRDKVDKAYLNGVLITLSDILSSVTSLQQEQPEVELEKAARHVYESWMGGTMDDVRRDMVNLGKVLNARKEGAE